MVLDKEIFKKNFIFSPNNLYRRYPVKTRISTDISRVRLQRYDRNVYAVITERKQYATPRRNKTTAKSKLHRTPGPFYTPVHVITTRKRFPFRAADVITIPRHILYSSLNYFRESAKTTTVYRLLRNERPDR